jgi:hypothetical protein
VRAANKTRCGCVGRRGVVAITCGDKRRDDLPEMLSGKIGDLEMGFHAHSFGTYFLSAVLILSRIGEIPIIGTTAY